MTYEPEKPDKKYKFDPNKFKHNILWDDYVTRKFMEANHDEDDFDEDDDDNADEKEDL
jgi:polyphosphate kinase 2 (PPK2 family)